jgi:5-hydroxyisourate hydrolase
MSHLTTHVLDTAYGKPAAGIRVVPRRADTPPILANTTTNADGRFDKPLLDGDALTPGHYEITFHVGDYFCERGVALADLAFFDTVPAHFAIAAERGYHMPLLISPTAIRPIAGAKPWKG